MSFQIQESTPQAGRGSTASATYDLIVVGFGTAALSLATALADQDSNLNILFLESNTSFTWTPASVLPENAVRTSFLRDLITTRNPRSEFTFVNYLFESEQLVQFTNSSHLTPSRLVMGNYLAWVARKMEQRGWVQYSSTVTSVTPVKNASSQIGAWNVGVRDASGNVSTVSSKRVVLATGAKPRVPAALKAAGEKVLHTSQVAPLLHNLKDQDIAIVGADQEAAEIFEHLQCAGALHRVRATMFISDSALRPEDNTSFTQDIIDDRLPGATTSSIPPELRPRFLSNTTTSTPKIALHTIETLYENLYSQRIFSSDASTWRFNVQPLAEVTSVQASDDGKVRLQIKNPRTGVTGLSARAFDVVVVAGGYSHSSSLLNNVESAGLLQEKKVTVDAEYKVAFRRDVVAKDTGLWILGSLESNDVRDSAFAFSAERGQRVAGSVNAVVARAVEERSEVAML